jgi:MFS transporter, BCD family, chlorophyll transporter
MIAAARLLVPRIGRLRTTAAGSVIAASGLAAVAVSGLTHSLLLLYAGIIALGLGLGALNVGALSLMLDMTAGHAAGLAMGLWTVAHAIADGAATAGGGVLHAVARVFLEGEAEAYAAVFSLEAIGLIAILGLLVRVDPSRFRDELQEGGLDAG